MDNELIKKEMRESAIPEKVDFYTKSYATAKNVIGIPVPRIKEIAKEIISENFERDFLQSYKIETHEDFLLRGLVIAYADMDLDYKFLLIDKYVSEIYDWSACDTVCAALKFKENELNKVLKYITNFLTSPYEFQARFGFVTLKTYFLKEEYLSVINEYVKGCSCTAYYCEMGIAWLVCEMFIKFRDYTLKFLSGNSVTDSVFKKTIQKIRESDRVSEQDKAFVNTLVII